jgi:hypothetical protein
MAPNPNMSSWQLPWRPTSGEICCLGLGRVTWKENQGVVVVYCKPPRDLRWTLVTLVALGRIDCEEIVY